MKKALCAAAALALMPSISNAQEFNPLPGVYVGAFGGGVWFLPTSTSVGGSLTAGTGYAVGLVGGYDFVGPRVELEVVFGAIPFSANLPTSSFSGTGRQLQVMGKALYDFLPASAITPYVGVGAGVAFIDSNVLFGSTQFAYEGIVGLGWNLDSQWRIALEGRYIGTTSPSLAVNGQTVTYNNNNLLAMVGAQYKFAPPAPPPPPQAPTVAPPSFMVFFDWDRSNLSQQALATIKQAADAFKAKGNARITATGHTDTSGPEAYNMALSLRRANAVKDALVREGVPAQAIAVIGRGEAGLLVKTADGVREPQNRRVEIVIQ
jgi:outer membrane protein OmpA-like peptidoglycan-associated protein